MLTPKKPLLSHSTSHILSAGNHIQQATDNLTYSKSDKKFIDCPELSKLQFIICQLQNSHVPKIRRRYNILTQILAPKTHLISTTEYNYLQSMSSLYLPHFNTLEKLYSSLGLGMNFSHFLSRQPQKHVIIQMDEIHVMSDISYKGGKIYSSSLKILMILPELYLLSWCLVFIRNDLALSVYYHMHR